MGVSAVEDAEGMRGLELGGSMVAVGGTEQHRIFGQWRASWHRDVARYGKSAGYCTLRPVLWSAAGEWAHGVLDANGIAVMRAKLISQMDVETVLAYGPEFLDDLDAAVEWLLKEVEGRR